MRPAILLCIFYGSLGCPTSAGLEIPAQPSPEAAFFPAASQPLSRSWFLRPSNTLPVRPPDFQAQKSLLFGPRRHRFMHFGKRENPFPLEDFVPDSRESEDLDGDFVLRPDQDLVEDYQDAVPDKRADDRNNFIHFGKKTLYELAGGRTKRSTTEPGAQDEDSEEVDAVKRATNRYMHFGKREDLDVPFKRAANRIMHFGKRDLDELDKRANRIMHFGKRDLDQLDKKANRIMHFGKRDLDQLDKRANRIMHFGKRDLDQLDKRVNRIMHFGKREDDDWLDDGEEKRAFNRMLHFGKRDPSADDSYYKRNPNRIMHFGKRMPGDTYERAAANQILHFGKQLPLLDELDKRGPNRIMHFGKRTTGVDKRAPNRILHFGKRDEDDSHEVQGVFFDDEGRQDGRGHVERTKRSAADDDDDEATLQRVVGQLIAASYDKQRPGFLAPPGPLHIPHAYMAAHVYRSAVPRMLSRPSRSDRYFPALLGHEARDPKVQTRNVFLRFG